MNSPCGAPILWGISPDFSGLSPCYRWIAYVLLTRAPVAGKGIATSPLPLDLHVLGLSLAFILSQDQTLRCIFFILYYTFEALPDRIDFFLSYFLYYTCFFNSFNELDKKVPRSVPRFLFCGCKVNSFSYSAPNFSQCFFELFFYEMKTFSFSDCYS